MMPASGEYTAAGTFSRTASNASALARVTSSVEPARTISRADGGDSSRGLPEPRNDSGNPRRAGAVRAAPPDPQPLVRSARAPPQETGVRDRRIKLAAGHLFEQIQQLFV